MRERLLAAEKIRAIRWQGDCLQLLDQRVLPLQTEWLEYRTAGDVAQAIREMVVRGAPAIGIAAAYGVALSVRAHIASGNADWRAAVERDMQTLAESRPTAVNLFWALDRMRTRMARLTAEDNPADVMTAEAVCIDDSDREANLTMAQFGVELLKKHHSGPQVLMTHCNTGALATGGFGTALGVLRAAHLEGLVENICVDETRPWLQGSRLTAWELTEEGIPATLNVDSAAAHILKTQPVTWVIVGADRITACGDVANKVGTYQLAVLAMHHGARFMVVAPSSTIDMALEHGEDIPIEERSGDELLSVHGQRFAADVPAYNPVFDVTPADLIDAIVTERGVVERPTPEKMAELMNRKRLH